MRELYACGCRKSGSSGEVRVSLCVCPKHGKTWLAEKRERVEVPERA